MEALAEIVGLLRSDPEPDWNVLRAQVSGAEFAAIHMDWTARQRQRAKLTK